MNSIKILILITIIINLYNFSNSNEIIIKVNIDNEIITNVDIENEKKYLLLLNNNLNKLTKKDFSNLAKNSLIREKIKEKEINNLLEKQIDINFENKIIENFYKRLRFDNKNDFIKYLEKKKVNYNNLKAKIVLEALWNQIIYNKFKNRIKIDNQAIKQKIINNYKTQENKYEYNLSEILVDFHKDVTLKKNEMKKYIKDYGFKIAANKYSKSDTSNYGGEIGWIKETRLSKKIKNKISKIKIGEITEEIQTPNGYLILKLNDKREIKEELNLEKELKQQINFERNRQLNQYSLNYYKKLKQNINVYEHK